jgi:hypothetical protein
MSLCRLRHNVRVVPRERGLTSRIERLGRHGKRCDAGSRGLVLQRRDLVGAVGDAAAAPLRLARDQDFVDAGAVGQPRTRSISVSMRLRYSASGTNRSGRIARKKWPTSCGRS